jgi:hypothetical protein
VYECVLLCGASHSPPPPQNKTSGGIVLLDRLVRLNVEHERTLAKYRALLDEVRDAPGHAAHVQQQIDRIEARIRKTLEDIDFLRPVLSKDAAQVGGVS